MKKYVQQIMLGRVLKNEAQTEAKIQELQKMGYEGLELNEFMIHHSPVAVKLLTSAFGMPIGKCDDLNWQKIIEDTKISIIALHSDLDSLEKKKEQIIADACAFQTQYIVITGLYRYDFSDEYKVKELAQRLNVCGKDLKASNLHLLYHNHNIELLNTDGGKKAYEILIEECDPEYVNFEFDSYWFSESGADAKLWMRRLGERMKLWHIADRGNRMKKASMTPIIKSDSVEIGTGNLDLEGMKQIAIANKVEAIIVETHRNWIDNDPMKSLKISGEWLHDHFE